MQFQHFVTASKVKMAWACPEYRLQTVVGETTARGVARLQDYRKRYKILYRQKCRRSRYFIT